MSFPFYIARRYLFSKKSTHAINVISAISVVGVAVATMALVVTLSVFNGFHDMVASFFTQLDPQLKVTPTKGKTAPADDPVLTQIRQPGWAWQPLARGPGWGELEASKTWAPRPSPLPSLLPETAEGGAAGQGKVSGGGPSPRPPKRGAG